MISIVIPTLNEENYLPRLLKSIKEQDFTDYEIIVADAGSSDKTEEIASLAGVKFIKVDKIKHPSYQRNKGAEIASGDVLLFLDADSVLPFDFLKAASAEFYRRNLVAAGFYIRFNPNCWYYNIYSFISNIICALKQFGQHPAAIGAGIMASKRAHQKINGFDLAVVLAEDYDYCARISREGRFRMIKSVNLLYSARRIEKEGFIKSGWKWFRMGIFTLTNRRIKKQITKYDFGKF